jgi:protein KRI1
MAAQPAVSQGSTLFDSDNEDGRVFKVNTKYANEYESRKQKEELRRVQFQGDDDDGESTDSSEDEDAELLTAKLDTNIIKTINILRSKDSRIYDPSVNFFDNAEDSEEDSLPTKESKSKPKRYKDVVREQILKQMDEDVPIGEENDNDYGVLASDEAKSRLAYDNRQQELRKAFVDSTTGKKGYGIDDDGEDSDDDSDTFLVVKKVSKGITEDEDTAEARQEFLQEMEKLEKTARDDNRDFVDPKGEVKDGERFLLDFFKRRNWLERDDGDSGPDGNSIKGIQPPRPIASDGNESENSLEQLHKTDDFEAQYNFRFEEAAAKSQSGADFSIIGYARGQTMNTLRRKDESRRDKRLSRKDRKVADRTAKEEQLKRLEMLPVRPILTFWKDRRRPTRGRKRSGGEERS